MHQTIYREECSVTGVLFTKEGTAPCRSQANMSGLSVERFCQYLLFLVSVNESFERGVADP